MVALLRHVEQMMDCPDIEPLDPVIWIESFAKLRASASAGPVSAVSAYLRKTYHLLVLAPKPLRPLFTPLVSEELFERLLDESLETAAMALLGGAASVEVSHDGAGPHVCIKLAIHASPRPVEVADHPLANGIVLAICDAVLGLLEKHQKQLT